MPMPTRQLAAGACVVAALYAAAPLIRGDAPAFDTGATGLWQHLLRLRTTASAMHLTAHPDDEQGGVLARLARRDGVRVTMLTLNRGEAGDNAIGPQLFDALGLIRTEELRRSNEYYGVARQYFTTVVDYGFSKRMDEAFEKWGRETVLRDMVRVIRTERPWVLISRFQGTERDGHGNHQTSGLLAREVFALAADPKAFPEQIAEGLRPWPPMKLYTGGWRENDDWQLRIDTGEYSPWLGDSYANVAARGFAFQRSQNGGRTRLTTGPSYVYYRRVAGAGPGPSKEDTFFDGIDTTVPALFRTLGIPAPAAAARALAGMTSATDEAVRAYSVSDPSASVPALVRGLSATREAISASDGAHDALRVLREKARQFQEAIGLALGLEFVAFGEPADSVEPTGPMAMFTSPPLMSNAVPGQTFQVRTTLTSRAGARVTPRRLTFQHAGGWTVDGAQPTGVLAANQPWTATWTVRLDPNARITNRPPFRRASIRDSVYVLDDQGSFGLPVPAPATAVVTYEVEGVEVEAHAVVRRRESNLPYGIEARELHIVPALSVSPSPRVAVIPLATRAGRVDIEVEVLNNGEGGRRGELRLTLPASWSSAPPVHTFAFSRAGERSRFRFSVTMPGLEERRYEVTAIATADGREYREGYDVLQHRDLETRYLYHPATVDVRGVTVATPTGLRVGYVMGVGDQVPSGIAQLGAAVSLLSERDLASADLSSFDAIVTGTRAYAVRDDLRTYNQRLLDYVRDGGNLVVLYNTPEFPPAKFAPFPGELSARAEEVSEEDSPIEILQPDARVFTWPNRITRADFDGWVEQRGTKFWDSWDAAYTPMLASHDKGQAPQRGGWLQARHGKGTYTYFAYAFHRQLPYGVPGAYRLLANVLSLGRTPD